MLNLRIRRGVTVSLGAILSATLLLPGLPVAGITQGEVDEACADSAEAYEQYKTARNKFNEAAVELERADDELDAAVHREQQIRDIYEVRQSQKANLEERVEQRAVELYMQSATSSGPATALMTSPEEFLTASEFLTRDAERTYQDVADLGATSVELEKLGEDLGLAVANLESVRNEKEARALDQEAAMADALDAYEHLSDDCRKLQAEYEAEQARIRAEREAQRRREAEQTRRADSGSGSRVSSPPPVVNGVSCPFKPGRTQFIDSWGYPRSGGRTHKGTDMFAPLNEPVYAVDSGRVAIRTGGLGGKTIWLTADNGVAYYYAHLNDWAVSNGSRVEQGQLIAYNGKTGNAERTSPHVHLQIHPSGRSGPSVNPYGTMAAACF